MNLKIKSIDFSIIAEKKKKIKNPNNDKKKSPMEYNGYFEGEHSV